MENKVKEFLKMNLDELYEHFVSFVLSNMNGMDVITKLKGSQRYASDYEFRAMVDFSEILNDGVYQPDEEVDYTKKIIRCIDIIDRTTAFKMWQLAANAWNTLAISYSKLAMFERALECYSHALRIESEHGLFNLSPILYSNMVNLFVQIEELDKAWNYIENAVQLLEKYKDKISRYWDKYVSVYSGYLYIKIRKMEVAKEDIKPYYDKIMAVDDAKLNYTSRSLKVNAKFHYGFFHFSPTLFKEILDEVKKTFGLQEYILFCHECIRLSKIVNQNYDFYIKELIALEEQGITHLPIANMQTYDILIEYYEREKNKKKLSECRIKYIECSKEHLKTLSEQQYFAINTIEQLVMSDEFKNTNNIRNVEFKLIAEETLKTKRELEKANAVLSKISAIDGLTQISNRRHFEEKMQNLLCHSHANHLTVSVFMMDIDYFKRYNDTYGHLEGDEILKKVAKCFNDRFESINGLSARFGGEEFVGAVAGLSIEETEELAQKISDEIFQLGIVNKSVRGGIVTVSVGAVIATKVDVNMKLELFRVADESLYLAKTYGKNRFEIKIL